MFKYSTAGLGQIKVNGKGSRIADGAERLDSIGEAGSTYWVHLDSNSQTAELSFLDGVGSQSPILNVIFY